ncbi:PP2C family protein-serine/threonine phosphatase [Streptantibioticus rubrisoli]|uniref:SpoIIE family protein phosphatase n=1 Tax=Streptantibioticus rubrisoli TaxID=1387313 RepID=A0ABT1PJE5_9ACTN|nr:SpoIIE family protein phosphatase [Streptantibioticus rubrisoli]MCQ4045492.1 SpoIIE family protein phosphatase [Streptantibioticus rubrisoli]
MRTAALDFAAVFAAAPAPCLVLDPELVIAEANEAYLRVTGRGRRELLGRHIFDAFPDNPADPEADGPRKLRDSLERVLSLRSRDVMAVHRYDIPVPGSPGEFEARWWSSVNAPVLGPDGEVAWIIHRVEDVTAYVQAHPPDPLAESSYGQWQRVEAELYTRGQELQRLNEELRQAHAEEREVGLALQRAMLYAPDLERHKDLALRYLPAVGTLNVCGDWYDVADISEDRLAAAVGDVVGHGLEAAIVMGMLRSALSAAIRASDGPARALEALGRYAESVEGALGTTAVKVLIDKRARMIVYSSAGHPPPVLLHTDGTTELLDKATDPPLGTMTFDVPRSQAVATYRTGDALVLYTDGLIERPGEDIDLGLNRLTQALTDSVGLDGDRMADSVLASLGVADGARDDIALLILCL